MAEASSPAKQDCLARAIGRRGRGRKHVGLWPNSLLHSRAVLSGGIGSTPDTRRWRHQPVLLRSAAANAVQRIGGTGRRGDTA